MSNAIYPSVVRGLGFTVNKTIEDAVIKQVSPSFASTRIVQNQNPIWHWSLLYDFLRDDQKQPNPSLVYSDLQALLGFVAARRNSYDDFLFSDPDDNFFGPGVITQGWLPNWPFQFGSIIVVSSNAWQVTSAPGGARTGYAQPSFASSPQTDGGLTWTELGAVPGSGWPNPQAQLQLVTDGTNWYSPLQIFRGGQFYEDITDLASALTVYANGTATTAYTLGWGGLSFSGFSSAGLYLNWGSSAPAAPVTASFNYLFRIRFEDDTEDFEKWANQLWTVGGSEGSRGKGELKLVTSRIPSATSGIPYLPSPPLSPPAGATQMAVLYANTATSFNGYTDLTRQQQNIANATTKPTPSGSMRVPHVGLGFVPPNVQFSNYQLPPTIPPGSLKAVYSYDSSALINGGMDSTGSGVSFTGGSHTLHPAGGLEIATLATGGSAANFPISSIVQTFTINASISGTYNPTIGYAVAPCVVVFY